MEFIGSLAALEQHYATPPSEAAMVKVARRLTPAYRRWIEQSRFCVLSTIGPEGTDASPRGDDGPVVRVLDPGTLALPDWRGNNRIDSLRNIVRDGRVSLMFIVAGSHEVIRVNGTARLTADLSLCESFARAGKLPRTVAIVSIQEVYAQCARALLRARLWTDGDLSLGLPTLGDMLAELSRGGIDGAAYDRAWPARASASLW